MTLTDLLAVLVVLGEWSGLARGLLGISVYAAALDVALVLLAVLALRTALSRPPNRRLGLLGALVLAYMIVAALEMLNPNVPGPIVALEGYRKSAFTMLAFFVVLWAPGGSPSRFFNIVAIGSIPAFLWATRQFFWPLPMDMSIIGTTQTSSISFHSGAVLRAFSPTAGPFHLGILAAAVMVIALVRSVSGSGWWIALSAVAAWTLGLTLTRANLVAGVLALATVAFVGFVLHGGWQTATKVLVPVAAAALAALVAVGVFSIQAPVLRTPQPTTLPTAAPSQATPGGRPTLAPTPKPDLGDIIRGISHGLGDKSLQLRFGYWRTYLTAIAERPLLGYGTSSAADGFGGSYTGNHRNFEPHSMYLKPALELGLGGLALFLAIALTVLTRTLRVVRAGDEDGILMLGVGVVVVVSGITGPMLDAYPFNVLFWASCGWMARIALLAPPLPRRRDVLSLTPSGARHSGGSGLDEVATAPKSQPPQARLPLQTAVRDPTSTFATLGVKWHR